VVRVPKLIKGHDPAKAFVPAGLRVVLLNNWGEGLSARHMAVAHVALNSQKMRLSLIKLTC